jgi:hypothetical protein
MIIGISKDLLRNACCVDCRVRPWFPGIYVPQHSRSWLLKMLLAQGMMVSCVIRCDLR